MKVVSAIITTYKRPVEIVERAAKSVLNQSYKNIELIIVDDSPSSYEQRDLVKKMVLSLGDGVRYIQHEKNLGACAARNTGLKYAKGDFVAFLDDDDEWLCEKIEKQMNLITKKDNVALVYCGRCTYDDLRKKESVQNLKFYRGYVYEKLIIENFIGSTSFPLIRRSVLEKVGGFDVKMSAAQDLELWLRIAKDYEIDYAEEPLVRYYIHEGEQITKNHKKKVEAYERLHELNKDYLESHPKAFSSRLITMATVCSNVDLKKARSLFWQALKLSKIPTIDMLKAFKWVYIMPMIKGR